MKSFKSNCASMCWGKSKDNNSTSNSNSSNYHQQQQQKTFTETTAATTTATTSSSSYAWLLLQLLLLLNATMSTGRNRSILHKRPQLVITKKRQSIASRSMPAQKNPRRQNKRLATGKKYTRNTLVDTNPQGFACPCAPSLQTSGTTISWQQSLPPARHTRSEPVVRSRFLVILIFF